MKVRRRVMWCGISCVLYCSVLCCAALCWPWSRCAVLCRVVSCCVICRPVLRAGAMPALCCPFEGGGWGAGREVVLTRGLRSLWGFGAP